MSKHALIFILSIVALNCSFSKAQECDTIFDSSEVAPQYNGGDEELLNYVSRDFSKIISHCIDRDREIIDKLRITLTISETGKIIDASFPKTKATAACQQEMKSKLLTMTGWAAGKINGKPVCSKYDIPVGCLYWK